MALVANPASEPQVESYYHATANQALDLPALAGEQSADVCVVGGGFSGLSAALSLAERGYDVVLLEAKTIGWGASGRNGGQICSAYSPDMPVIEKQVGKDDARRLFALAEEAKDLICQRVEQHAIDCDLTWGYFLAADRPRQLDALAAMHEGLRRDYAYTKTDLIHGHAAVREQVDSRCYVGGLTDSGAGHLHPLNYCLGLARAAAAAGVRLFENSRVIAVEQGPKPAVRTETGEVAAEFLVLCGNAYLDRLVPALHRKIMPLGTYIAATVPFGADRARTLIPENAAVADCNAVLNYYRLSADHRLLFGGRVSSSAEMPPNLPRVMRAKMLRVFPQLSDIGFDLTWGGRVAVTVERTPHVGRLDSRIYFAQGFSGHGVALTGIAGQVIAEAIDGQAGRFDVMARLPHRDFPPEILRRPALALAILWHRLQDIL